tara:strand:+ start:600 stop:998 length:399 start_codon:yes stop_codon:yes gene_type:complete
MSDDIVKTLLESLTDEQKAELVKSLVNTKKPEEQEEMVSSDVDEDFRVTKTKPDLERGRTPVRARNNRWEDTGEWQLPEGEEEWEGSRKKATRNRSKAKKVKLECSVCGKVYYENPNLVYGEYHRCNRCGGK